jgi:cobalt-zinc-cadmium efflux system outer membrane protein
LQAQISADEAYILLDNAQNDNVSARRRLAAVTGLPNLPSGRLTGQLDSELPKFQWDHCQAMVLENNPELAAARMRIERAGVMIGRARREPLPDVDLSASVGHHNVSGDDVANVQLGIPIPVFNRNQGNIAKAEAQWIAAQSDVERLELNLRDRLAVAYRRYANARGQVERYQARMIPKAKESLDLVTQGYEKGQVEYLTLLTAQQTFLRVNLSYLASWQELRTSMSLIEGQLLSGSLEPGR